MDGQEEKNNSHSINKIPSKSRINDKSSKSKYKDAALRAPEETPMSAAHISLPPPLRNSANGRVQRPHDHGNGDEEEKNVLRYKPVVSLIVPKTKNGPEKKTG